MRIGQTKKRMTFDEESRSLPDRGGCSQNTGYLRVRENDLQIQQLLQWLQPKHSRVNYVLSSSKLPELENRPNSTAQNRVVKGCSRRSRVCGQFPDDRGHLHGLFWPFSSSKSQNWSLIPKFLKYLCTLILKPDLDDPRRQPRFCS